VNPVPNLAYRYIPTSVLDGEPHVMLDGAPRSGTVCTLSHWPGTPTPVELWADVSAEITLAAMASHGSLPAGVELATIDHYDADGVISLGLLTLPGLASSFGPMLADAAHVGDFDVVRAPESMRVSFALAALEAGADVATTAERALDVLPRLCADSGAFEGLWGPQWTAFESARSMVMAGAVVIEEHPAHDLAVVRVDEDRAGIERASWGGAAVHPSVIHSATSCMRVATLVGRHYEVRYRYESWVRLMSRRPRPRVDLTELGQALDRSEVEVGGPSNDGDHRWEFDGTGAITPALRRRGGEESALSPEQFLSEVTHHLERLDAGAPAWDPYRQSP